MVDPVNYLSAAPITRTVNTALAAPQTDEEREQSLLSLIGYGALSGLEKVGNVLDLPGSMVRDVIGLENPFDQLLSPLSHASTGKSLSGRDALAQNPITGLIVGENQETGMSGWLSNPWEGAQDIAGLGFEFATDPLGWVAGWSKGVGAAGKAAKATGKVDEVADATKAVGETLPAVVDAAAKPRIQRFKDPLKVTGDAVELPPATGIFAKVGRGLTKAGDFVDKYDPGFQLGKAARGKWDTNEPFRAFIGKHSARLSEIASKPLNAVRERTAYLRSLRGSAEPLAGPERTRVAQQAVDTFGEQANANMAVMDAHATMWANKTGRDADEWFTRVSDIRKSDPSQVGPDALRQKPPVWAREDEWWQDTDFNQFEWQRHYGISNAELQGMTGEDEAIGYLQNKLATDYRQNQHPVLAELLGEKFNLTPEQVEAIKLSSDDVMDLIMRNDRLFGMPADHIAARVSPKMMDKIARRSAGDAKEFKSLWGGKTFDDLDGHKMRQIKNQLDAVMAQHQAGDTSDELLARMDALQDQIDEYEQRTGEVLYQGLWHGTPHRWEPEPGFPHGRPRLDKMGSGEGNQAFGWGWYSAESPFTASNYHRKLTRSSLSEKLQDLEDKVGFSDEYDEFEHILKEIRAEYRSDPSNSAYGFSQHELDVLRALDNEDWLGYDHPRRAVMTALDPAEWNNFDFSDDTREVLEDAGSLYKLEIPDEDVPRLIVLDDTLDKQSDFVKQALSREVSELAESAKKLDKNQNSNWGKLAWPTEPEAVMKRFTGKEIYQMLSEKYGGDKQASEYLASIGILGNRHLDGASRRKGQGTYNYVIWDQGLLDRTALLERNGRKLDALRQAESGDVLQQGARGAVQFEQDGKAVIHAFQGADISTLAHETAHIFRRSLAEADPELLQRALDAIGGTTWDDVAAEEAFAKGFESYLRTGSAPTRELRSVFAQFKEWLTDIYRRLVGQDPGKISPELRSVFDEMLGGNLPQKPVSRTDDILSGLVGAFDTAAPIVGNALDAGRRALHQQFNPNVRGASSEIMQRAARLHSATEHELIQEFSQPITAIMGAIDREVGHRVSGLEDWADSAPHALLMDDVVTAVEVGDYTTLPVSMQGPAQQLRVVVDEMQSRAVSAGLQRPELKDLFVEHFVHELTPSVAAWEQARTMNVASSGDGGATTKVNNKPSQSLRGDLFRNGAEGRRTWNSVTADDEILNILEGEVKDIPAKPAEVDDAGNVVKEAQEAVTFTEAQKKEQRILAAAEKIREKYASEIDPRMPHIKEDKYQDVVTLIAENGEEIELPIGDLMSGMEWSRIDNGHNLRTAEGRLKEFASPILYEPAAQAAMGSSVPQLYKLKLSETDRYTELARYMYPRTKPLRNTGVFNANALTSMQQRIYRDANTIGALKGLPTLLSGAFRSGQLGTEGAGVPLSEFFSSNLFSRADRRLMYQKMVDQVPELQALADTLTADQFPEFMDNLILSTDLRDEMLATVNMLSGVEHIDKVWFKAHRGATAMFKAGVLTHPARYVRDLMSASFALVYNNMVTDASARVSWDAFWHRPSPELQQMPQVQAWMKRFGMEDTPENATAAAHEMYAAMVGHGQSIYRDPNIENMPLGEQLAKGFVGVEHSFPGTGATNMKEVGSQIARAWQSGTWNPLDIAGVPNVFVGESKKAKGIKLGDVRRESDFKFAKVADVIGKNVDNLPRFTGFIDQMMKGKSAEDAYKAVTRVQLDYNPRSFGPGENRHLKKWFPFYSFIRQQSVYMANELMTNPTGRLGKLIRLARHSQPDNQYLPDHVGESLALPFGGQSEDGTQNYLTGLGLMFEDPPKFIGDDSRDTMREILSRTNPMIKGFAEWSLGRSLFQSGPLGGRDLEDMDPVLGRIFTNLGLQDPRPGGQAAPAFGSRLLEFTLSNSPVSRILSTTKTLTESSERKNVLEKALNTLSGIKITSVSPQVQQRGLRELSNAIAKELGSRPFTTFHVSEELLEDAREKDPARYQTLLAIKELRKIWDRRRKAELKAAEAAAE